MPPPPASTRARITISVAATVTNGRREKGRDQRLGLALDCLSSVALFSKRCSITLVAETESVGWLVFRTWSATCTSGVNCPAY
ncbi:MAG TPA: hypothetical protein EYP49_16565 [Anaerolineae bacterium]|nr:hypothetical protein [Anaerolineae bacterium]